MPNYEEMTDDEMWERVVEIRSMEFPDDGRRRPVIAELATLEAARAERRAASYVDPALIEVRRAARLRAREAGTLIDDEEPAEVELARLRSKRDAAWADAERWRRVALEAAAKE